MKRSRRVVLTMMGSAAAGAVSMGLVPQGECGPRAVPLRDTSGRIYCQPTAYGGFGGTLHRLHGYAHEHGHGYAHAGG